MAIRFDNRAAIVTGAGRGIGRSYALELASRGARVVVNDIGGDLLGDGASRSPADNVVAEIQAGGGEAFASYDDISDPIQAQAMVDTAMERYGSLDILVNNAGNLFHHEIAGFPVDEYRRLVGVHLDGTFNATRAACLPMFAAGWGRIVMTTSQVGFFGKPESGIYGAAKMGVVGLMATLALEAAPHGVLVNAVSPLAYTRMATGTFPEALERLLDPAQISAAVAYLASETCEMSGQIVVAGGGHFSAARMVETIGIDIEDPAAITAEAIAARIDEITDMKSAHDFPDAMSAVGATFEKLRRRAG